MFVTLAELTCLPAPGEEAGLSPRGHGETARTVRTDSSGM
jgi:hypothetical protein